ncbi:MAG: hypothetical protein BWX70_02696 [Verrucomicrobia bacterium ADurb.Bin070]|nr:MAG: hypothetical protein BWX70_02696 [Verrucomicrobia bacterium ADurb.Bin070]
MKRDRRRGGRRAEHRHAGGEDVVRGLRRHYAQRAVACDRQCRVQDICAAGIGVVGAGQLDRRSRCDRHGGRVPRTPQRKERDRHCAVVGEAGVCHQSGLAVGHVSPFDGVVEICQDQVCSVAAGQRTAAQRREAAGTGARQHDAAADHGRAAFLKGQHLAVVHAHTVHCEAVGRRRRREIEIAVRSEPGVILGKGHDPSLRVERGQFRRDADTGRRHDRMRRAESESRQIAADGHIQIGGRGHRQGAAGVPVDCPKNQRGAVCRRVPCRGEPAASEGQFQRTVVLPIHRILGAARHDHFTAAPVAAERQRSQRIHQVPFFRRVVNRRPAAVLKHRPGPAHANPPHAGRSRIAAGVQKKAFAHLIFPVKVGLTVDDQPRRAALDQWPSPVLGERGNARAAAAATAGDTDRQHIVLVVPLAPAGYHRACHGTRCVIDQGDRRRIAAAAAGERHARRRQIPAAAVRQRHGRHAPAAWAPQRAGHDRPRGPGESQPHPALEQRHRVQTFEQRRVF